MYGKNVQLIMPEKGFAVKTKNLATGGKVFVNVCSTTKVCPYPPFFAQIFDLHGQRRMGLVEKSPAPLGQRLGPTPPSSQAMPDGVMTGASRRGD